ncbi:MAG: lysophospholipid acyltransferase family protein [Bacteroides sp.]|nr:lysophospholipid acyltransferase family protein [Bacteroides sp.]
MMYHLLSFLLKLISYIPFRVLYVLSDGLYYILYYIIRYRRKIVRKNLTESFPTLKGKEILQVEKKFYRYFTDQVLESCKMATISPEEMKKHMKFTNIEAANAVFKEGKSIALYMGHYGNWEWISSIPLWVAEGVTSVQIYHKLRNDNTNRLILNMRERLGAISVEMRKTARYITEITNTNQVSVIGFIADQSPKKKEVRYFLPFLHHRTPILVGTEKIVKHYGFEAWFLDMKRVKRGYYEAELIRMHEEPASLPDFELTEIYFRMLEKMIQERPELYLWTHNRFKHATKLEEA